MKAARLIRWRPAFARCGGSLVSVAPVGTPLLERRTAAVAVLLERPFFLRRPLRAASTTSAQGPSAAPERKPGATASLEDAFLAELPELQRSGRCLAAFLQLPLGPDAAEPLKAVMLWLARRLRQQKGAQLANAELPFVPLVLQRVSFKDDLFFDDYCAALGRAWPELGRPALEQTLRNVEDYSALLHPTKGTALVRAAEALQASLVEAASGGNASKLKSGQALASLVFAVLAVRGRDACRPVLQAVQGPLLQALSEALPKKVSGGAVAPSVEAAELLEAASALHVSEGLPEDVVRNLVAQCDSHVAALTESPDWGLEHGLALMRACGTFYWTAPADAEAVLVKLLGTGKLVAIRDARHLPGPLRRRVAEHLLLAPKGEPVPKRSAGAIAARLKLLHDLPELAGAAGEEKACAELCKLVEGLLSEMVECAKDAHVSSLAVAFMAASSAARCPEAGNAEQLASLGSRVLSLVGTRWGELTAKDVQVLFRSPAGIPELTGLARKKFSITNGVHAQLNLLVAAADGWDEAELQACKAVLLDALGGATDAVLLAKLEAYARRAHWSPVAGEVRAELLAKIRSQLFHATLQARPVHCHRPARGYVQYVERCVQRGREHWLESQQPQDSVSEQAPTQAADLAPSTPSLPTPRLEPRSEVRGVTWHRGLGAWEARVDLGGRRRLAGYFHPMDKSDSEVLRARLLAEEQVAMIDRRERRQRGEEVQQDLPVGPGPQWKQTEKVLM